MNIPLLGLNSFCEAGWICIFLINSCWSYKFLHCKCICVTTLGENEVVLTSGVIIYVVVAFIASGLAAALYASGKTVFH